MDVNLADANQLVAATTFGVLLSEDRGQTWDWVCEEATGFADEVPQLRRASDGTVYAATPVGLHLSRDLGCTWEAPTEVAGIWVSDLQQHPSDAAVTVLTTADEVAVNRVLRSSDGARTFSELLSAPSTLYDSVRFAPSQPQRLYVGAWWHDPGASWLLRSDDGGATWTRIFDAPPTARPLRVLAVDPTTPDRLFASYYLNGTNHFVRSDDGGATFAQLLTFPENIRDLEVTSDGEAWLANSRNVYYSGNGLDGFTVLAQPVSNACVARAGDTVFACASPPLDGFALARWAPKTNGFVPTLQLSDIERVRACPAGTPTREQCEPAFAAVRAMLEQASPATTGCTAAPSPWSPWIPLVFVAFAARRRAPR